jgi:hypothetical protein
MQTSEKFPQNTDIGETKKNLRPETLEGPTKKIL